MVKNKVAEHENVKPVTPRGRPSQRRVAAIEKNILSAARINFLDHGYSGTSMDSVAQMAGVSKNTLYARYPDKGSLFEAVARDRLQMWWIDMPKEVLPSHVPVPERLLRRGLALLRMLRLPEVGAFSVLIASEYSRFPHLAHAFRKEGYDPLIQLIAADLRAATQMEGWPVTDPVGVAHSFIAALQGWHMASDLDALPTEDDCLAFVSRLVTIFVTGRAGW